MSTKTFCHCANCKCSGYCFYNNCRVKIDYAPFGFIVIDISCVIANCEYIEANMPEPIAWSFYGATSCFEYLFSKYLYQVSNYLNIAKNYLSELKTTEYFTDFLSEYLLPKIKDFGGARADDVRKQANHILRLLLK